MLRHLAWICLAATLGWSVRHALSGAFDGRSLALRSHAWSSAIARNPPQSTTLEGTVAYVDDGDTIILADNNNQKHRIRLANIDAPEITHPHMPAQPCGYRAKQYLTALIGGKQVEIVVSDRDQYGREIGDIHLDGQDIDLLMVQQGLAWAYRRYLPSDLADTYIRAEDRAKRTHRGLWSDPNPTPPWDWRHEHRPTQVGILDRWVVF